MIASSARKNCFLTRTYSESTFPKKATLIHELSPLITNCQTYIIWTNSHCYVSDVFRNSEDVEAPFTIPFHLLEQVHAFEAGLDISELDFESPSLSSMESNRTKKSSGANPVEIQSSASTTLDEFEGDPEKQHAMKENVWS